MKLPNVPRTIIKPADDACTVNITDASRSTLATALTHVTLDVHQPGTDITLGTTFYTPIVTLLAHTLNTRRQDLVYCAWPLLGCPYHFFEQALPTLYIDDKLTQGRVSFKEMLDTRMLAKNNQPAVLWEILDLLQSVVGWKLTQLIEWTRVVEQVVQREHAGLLTQLQAMADQARKMHDDAGMLSAEIGLTEGVVISAGGEGRIQ